MQMPNTTSTQLGILVEKCSDFGVFLTRHEDLVEMHKKRPNVHTKFYFQSPNIVWRGVSSELEDGEHTTHIYKVGVGNFTVYPETKQVFLNISNEIIAKIRLQNGSYHSHENYCSKNNSGCYVKFFDLCRSKTLQNPVKEKIVFRSEDGQTTEEIDLGLKFAVRELNLSYLKTRERFVETLGIELDQPIN